MPYKISGTLSDAARIIVIKESDWSIESNTEESVGAYEVLDLENTPYLVAGRKSDGEAVGFGNITPEEVVIPLGGDRGVFGGGATSSPTSQCNVMDYITISTPGNATDFGDLIIAIWYPAACSNGQNDRGVWGGGRIPPNSWTNIIQYITISSTGNATDFGDLTIVKDEFAACSNNTNNRGVFGGSYSGGTNNVIDYITISTPGNAIDFGDMTTNRRSEASCSNAVSDRGVFGGGHSTTNIIDYITISTTGNTTDFGDLTVSRYTLAATSNGIYDRGLFGGGSNESDTIDYITISSTGNATDFGDLTVVRYWLAATSNNINGVWASGDPGNFDVIDYVTIETTGNATDFGNLTLGRGGAAGLSNA